MILDCEANEFTSMFWIIGSTVFLGEFQGKASLQDSWDLQTAFPVSIVKVGIVYSLVCCESPFRMSLQNKMPQHGLDGRTLDFRSVALLEIREITHLFVFWHYPIENMVEHEPWKPLSCIHLR